MSSRSRYGPDYYAWEALKLNNATYFEFAFENYTALGYGEALPLIGPITALNGLLLVGWSVAVIFEVMRMAELSFGRSRSKHRGYIGSRSGRQSGSDARL